MPRLVIDTITAAIALGDLAVRGNDLVTLAQAVDEDWQRFATDPRAGGRYMISTIGNRTDCPPNGETYYNTQLLQPGPIRAEDRDIKDRFMRGKPMLCAESIRDDKGCRLVTALLRLSMHGIATFDRMLGVATFYLDEVQLPMTISTIAPGRRLSDVIAIPGDEGLVIRQIREAPIEEMRLVKNHISDVALAIETDLPGDIEIAYERMYPLRIF